MDKTTTPKKVVTPEEKKRMLYFGNSHLNHQFRYPSNFIRTSKYTLITFLPKSILLQFEKYANIYFLITAILQSIPAISPLSPFSAIAPVIFVIFLAVCREGFEDWLRHVSDNELNASTCTVYREGKFVQQSWRHLAVGDIVRVEEEEFFPADIIVFSCSNDNGMCYKKRASTCAKCNKEIVGKIYSAMNKTFHIECFVCSLCNKAFDEGSYIPFNDQAYHSECYKAKFTMFCFICRNEIWGEYLFIEGAVIT